MGGPAIRHEPDSIALLELHQEVYQRVGWVDYFQRLQVFDHKQVLEFTRNLWDGYSIVQGV